MEAGPSERTGRYDAIELFRELESHRTDAPALAEPMDRAIARLIDFAIAGAIVVAVSMAVFSLIVEPAPPGPRAPGFNPNRDESRLADTAAAIAGIAYFAVADLFTRSPGKRVMKLSIVRSDGLQPPPLARRVLRLAAWALPLALALAWWASIFLTLLGLLALAGIALALAIPGTMFLDGDKRGLHDRLAGTRVVIPRR